MEHPSVEDLLKERLSSKGYNVLREIVNPTIYKSMEDFEGVLGKPFDEAPVGKSCSMISVGLLSDLIRLHYELQIQLESEAAKEASELADMALVITQKVHNLVEKLGLNTEASDEM